MLLHKIVHFCRKSENKLEATCLHAVDAFLNSDHSYKYIYILLHPLVNEFATERNRNGRVRIYSHPTSTPSLLTPPADPH